MNKDYIGRFNGKEIAHDPGFGAKCIVSGKPLIPGKVYTISLMSIGGERCYFFRVLKEARDGLSIQEKEMYESSIIDNEKTLQQLGEED